MDETTEDFLARLNLEGARRVWVNNRKTIDYVFHRTRRYRRGKRTACEIGLGEGYLLRKLAHVGIAVTGVDVSGYLVDTLRARFAGEGIAATLVCAEFGGMVLAHDALDLVYCLDVLEHVPDDSLRKGMAQLARSMRAGGFLIGTVPFRENLDYGMMMCPCCGHKFHRVGHHRAFSSVRDIVSILPPDLRVVEVFEVPPKLFPFMIANRVANMFLRVIHAVRGSEPQTTICFVAEVARR